MPSDNGNGSQDTAGKQRRLANLKNFVKGDPRINRAGRPKSFDEFRFLAQKIAHQNLTLKDGRKLTIAEALLEKCARSGEPALIKTFFEYAFGKVPDRLETTGLENRTTLILNYADEKQSEGRSRVPPTVSLGAE
jgi:hypothetical protein